MTERQHQSLRVRRVQRVSRVKRGLEKDFNIFTGDRAAEWPFSLSAWSNSFRLITPVSATILVPTHEEEWPWQSHHVTNLEEKKKGKQGKLKKLSLLLSLSYSDAGWAYEQSLSTNRAAFSTGHGTRKSMEGGGYRMIQNVSLPLLISGLLQHESDPLKYSNTVTQTSLYTGGAQDALRFTQITQHKDEYFGKTAWPSRKWTFGGSGLLHCTDS